MASLSMEVKILKPWANLRPGDNYVRVPNHVGRIMIKRGYATSKDGETPVTAGSTKDAPKRKKRKRKSDE